MLDGQPQILIVDLGSQYTEIIRRNLRYLGFRSVILAPEKSIAWAKENKNLKGIILSGGSASVYDADAPKIPEEILNLDVPVLGVCLGMQWLAFIKDKDAVVAVKEGKSYGPVEVSFGKSLLFEKLPEKIIAWSSHGDSVRRAPKNFKIVATSKSGKVIEAIEMALAAAYRKDYGKKNQIIRATFDQDSGKAEFSQVKIVVDKSMLREDDPTSLDEEVELRVASDYEYKAGDLDENGQPKKEKWNEERHIMIEDAKRIKKDAEVGDELIFPLEVKDDFGRIAAQTAKQTIIQKIREAEKYSVLDEYGKRVGEIVHGSVQRQERGNVYVTSKSRASTIAKVSASSATLPPWRKLRGALPCASRALTKISCANSSRLRYPRWQVVW